MLKACAHKLIAGILLSMAITVAAAPGKPQRIVSLDLCTDWMLQTYVESARILALSPLSQEYTLNDRSSAYKLHNGGLEQILSLQPDLVLSGEFNAPLLRQQLQKLGVAVEVLPLANSLAGVREYEQRFAQVTGVAIKSSRHVYSDKQETAGEPRLLLLGANAGGTGRATLEDEIIRAAGWRNYVTGKGYIKLDLEKLVNDPPDVIMWSAPSSPALANLFREHPALNKRIAEQHWLQTDYGQWQCQGPWTWQRIQQLQQARQVWKKRAD